MRINRVSLFAGFLFLILSCFSVTADVDQKVVSADDNINENSNHLQGILADKVEELDSEKFVFQVSIIYITIYQTNAHTSLFLSTRLKYHV
jgi:hypothetical protein